MAEIWPWVIFNGFVLAMLALDLFVFHREAHRVRLREAAVWSVVWVALALAFCAGIYWFRGPEAGTQFLTGYLLEKALSVDNIFVFVLIFGYFRVPPQFQHRVLFWGILGALVMRGTMIAAGAFLVSRFHWILYIFGAFLVITGLRMATQSEHHIELESNPVLRLLKRIMPISRTYEGSHFFVQRETSPGRMQRMATPLFVVLVLIETTDLVFAVDSIPAVFAITTDPFLVYTSNIFAILGLRSLYFLLAGVVHRFHFLKLGLSAVLVLVGVKMLIADVVHVPIGLSLGVIALIITASIVASMIWPKERDEHDPLMAAHDPLKPRPDHTPAPVDVDRDERGGTESPV
ncbi:TerC family protein [Sandaracinus amylolyticus]|uniref:Integral membrane protein TerC n=1 Tax=Sandaracinus amylolyticus TaxID=927083 RepID=A0A0F6W941_9BACT|nr:TerC family protein [Sandaracinus amylolyticus]AKF10542.1 Integral membrane protein TerC [Sandaracinus amylolyticus]